jgi:hypothetical protein
VTGQGRDSRDPRWRPPDPAGTKPKHDPQSLLPQRRAPLLPAETQAAGDGADAGSALATSRGGRGDLAVAGALSTSRWTPRFRVLLGVLLGIGVVAVAAVVLLAVRGEDPVVEPPAWSAWAPSAGGDLGAQQIAQHVSPAYKLGNGRQLVQVGAGPLEVDGVPLDVAVRQAPAEGGNIQYFDDGGVMYRMCGLGAGCSIAGKASAKRGLLLGREGLELALYSFHYLDAKSVVVLLPPAPGDSPARALFFRRENVAAQLARPLGASLSPRVLSPSTVARSPDAALVAAVATPRIFKFSLTRANTEGRGILVLDPPDADSSQTGTSQQSGSSTGSGG